MKLKKFTNKNILILGYGITGQDVLNIINENNNVYIVDDNFDQKLLDYTIYTGVEFLKLDAKIDFIVKSPGIKYDNLVLRAYKNITIINDIEIAYEIIKQRNIKTIAITGTNGKTSTTSFITTLLNSVGYSAYSCGNIGISPLKILNEYDNIDFLVLELSSFQLKAINKFKPDYAVFLNFSPDHLDYHDTIEDYYTSKMKLFKNNNIEMKIYLGDEIEYSSQYNNVSYRNTHLIQTVKEAIDGIYYENVEIIYPLLKDLNIQDEQIIDTLKNKFKPLPHRMEFIANINGVKYINDSKATNVDATSVALKQYNNIILISGGYDKKENIGALSNYTKNVKLIICYGQNKVQFKNLIDDVIMVEDLKEAVLKAKMSAVEGDTVLLSPASASYDMFKNYEERGDKFRELVESI